jgi:hypothetical protein
LRVSKAQAHVKYKPPSSEFAVVLVRHSKGEKEEVEEKREEVKQERKKSKHIKQENMEKKEYIN